MTEKIDLPRATLAAALGGVAAALATWYLVGDLSYDSPAATDRILDPPDIPPLVEHVVGIAALLLLGGCLVAALRPGVRRSRPTVAVLVLLVVAGVLLGVIGRVVTAGGIGANIGGGFAILVGLPLVAVLVLAAGVTTAVAAWRRTHSVD